MTDAILKLDVSEPHHISRESSTSGVQVRNGLPREVTLRYLKILQIQIWLP